MSDTVAISCNISPTDSSAGLGIEVWLDDQQLLNQESVSESIEFRHNLSNDVGEHQLRFVMKNKTAEHTKIDEQSNILSDACLTITNLAFDEVELKQIAVNLAVYKHDFNGSQAPIQTQFYGEMGCNGTVSLKFTTPVYLWLLENMSH